MESRPLDRCGTDRDRRRTTSRRGSALLGTVLAVGLSVSACSSKSDSSGTGGSNGSGSASGNDFVAAIGKPADPALCKGKQYTFGFDTFSDTDNFANAVYSGLQAYAKALGCVKIKRLTDNANAATAVQNANIFAQQRVDGAILFNVVQAASQGQAQVLAAARIPVVSLAVPVQGKPFITNDDTQTGTQGGTKLGEAYLAKKTKQPAYAIIGRYDGQDSTKQRMDGAIAGLKKTVPDVRILAIDTKTDGPTAQANTAAVLPKIPTGAQVLVIGVNDDVTYAMNQAVKRAQRQADSLVMSIGGVNPTGMQFLCQNSNYVGSVGFFPENWPSQMLPALIGEVNGASIPSYPKKIIVPTTVITRQTITKYYPKFVCK